MTFTALKKRVLTINLVSGNNNIMPTVYVKKTLYDALVKSGHDPSVVVNLAVEQWLKEKVKK